MKGIILAAGKGTRMGSKTFDQPKCMIDYNNKSLIKHTVETMKKCDIREIIVVNGYKKEILENHLINDKVRFITNDDYDKTNMVYTLFCAQSEMDDDIIISYSDIIYNEKVLNKLINNKNDIVITVDRKWRELWEIRMENPLEDAETMKVNHNGEIIELGKKPITYEEVNGQYIGLIKISKNALLKVINFYNDLDKTIFYDEKDFHNIYMTTFIQLIIDNLLSVNASFVNGGWLEFDTENDLNIYNLNKLKI